MTLRFVITLALSLCAYALFSQCLTDFKKLLPDQTPSYSEGFGYSVDVKDDILAIGAPFSDTLGFNSAGIVYLYQKVAGEWSFLTVLRPSDPVEQLQFGLRLSITQDYILVGGNLTKKALYIFRKPVSGWVNDTETVRLSHPGTSSFGAAFDMSDDQRTLLVADITYKPSNGAVFVYRKAPADEWSTSHLVQIVQNPEPNDGLPWFGSGGVELLGNKFAVHDAIGGGQFGAPVQIFTDNSGAFNNFTREAKLALTTTSTGSYGPSFIFNEDGIIRYRDKQLHFYTTPSSGTWSDQGPSCSISINEIDGVSLESFFYVNYASSGGKIYITASMSDGSKRLAELTKKGITWCDGFDINIIHYEPPPSQNGSTLFVRALDADGTDQIACSWISSVESGSPTAVSVGIFNKQPDQSWKKKTFFRTMAGAEGSSFGHAVYRTGDFLITSAAKERVLDAKSRGSVYIFRKDANGDFKKVNKLSMSPSNPDDFGFGSTITGNGNYLAVSAHGYKPDRIYMYKGVNGDFSNPVLIQTIPMPTGKFIDSYGQMKMNKDWLVVPVGTNGPDGARLKLLMFRRSGEQWTYSYDINLGLMFIFTKAPPAIDMNDHTLVATSGYQEVSVLTLSLGPQPWVTTATLRASDPDKDPFFIGTIDLSFFGTSVKLTEEQIFVGAYGKNVSTVLDVGVIYVYQRTPDGTWLSGTESSRLLPKVIAEKSYFGYTIDALDNTLITGSTPPGGAGKAWVLQSLDFYWDNTIELLVLQGDTFVEDKFGYNVSLDYQSFVIAATAENNSQGAGAGTVYYVPTPPILKLEKPVCLTTAPYRLRGYPFEGTWSGPGITDALTGEFSPQVAGAGLHEITYITPNCHYAGKLYVEVIDATVSRTSPMTQLICTEGKKEVTLSVELRANALYKWYYINPQTNVAEQLGSQSNQVKAGKAGEYRVEMKVSYCSSMQTFQVQTEQVAVAINPLPVVCDRSVSTIDLVANQPGGEWMIAPAQSTDLINETLRQLNVAPLANGTYTVHYRYTSSQACIYRASQGLLVDRLAIPPITRSGHLCEDGEVLLSTTSLGAGARYHWKYSSGSGPVSNYDTDEPNLVVVQHGNYSVVVENSLGCMESSTNLRIDDQFFVSTLPAGNVFTTCPVIPFSIEAEQTAGDSYEWYYAAEEGGEMVPLDASDHVLEVSMTGYYRVEVARGACTFRSESKFVTVTDPYELFAPNVFTPNGDGLNDRFLIASTYERMNLLIYDRYGRKVFESDNPSGWDGTNSPSGTYYWHASFVDCDNNSRSIKGWVHLVR